MILKNNFWPKFTDKEINLVKKILKSGKINQWTGNYNKLFSNAFKKSVRQKYAIPICNGSLALDLAVRSLNLKPFSQILVTSRSFVATAKCITNNHHHPIFLDESSEYSGICLKDLKKKFNKKVKAIICAHIGGYPNKIDEIKSFAKEKNIFLIEDCSQSHGGNYKNKPLGSFSDISVWSFCQDKIISTGGEGGMITTNNKKIYEYCNQFKDHGKNFNKMNNKKYKYSFKYLHDFNGTNLRLTEIQCAMGLIQLSNLKKNLITRRKFVKELLLVLQNYKYIKIMPYSKINDCSWYRLYFTINFKKIKKTREEVLALLNSNRITSNSGTCCELYKEKIFKNFKTTEKKYCNYLAKNSIALVIHPFLNKKEIIFFKKKIIKVLESLK